MFSKVGLAAPVTLTCSHFKTTHYCAYEFGKKQCSYIVKEGNDMGSDSIVVSTKTQKLSYNNIDNIPYFGSGTVIKFYLSAPLGDTENFYEIESSLNRVSGLLKMDWRMDVTDRNNKHMYPNQDQKGFGTSYTHHFNCSKTKALF